MGIEQRQGPGSKGEVTYSYQPRVSLELRRLETQVGPAVADFGPFANIFETLVVVAVRRQCVPEMARRAGLHQSRDRRVEFLCTRSLVNYWAHIYFDHLFLDRPDHSDEAHNVRALLEYLSEENSYAVWLPIERDPETWAGPIVVGSLGYLSKTASENPECTVLASGYSTIDYVECVSPFQCARDPVGLRIEGGQVTSPPLYGRPLVLQNASETRIAHPEELSCLVRLPWREDFIPLSSNEQAQIQVHTRAKGRLETPIASGITDLVVVENRIVALCFGGGIEIPRAGFVISIPSKVLNRDRMDALRTDSFLHYILDPDSCPLVTPHFGLQCGPTLVRDGAVQLSAADLVAEDFLKESRVLDLAPRNVWKSTGDAKAARSLIGVDGDGRAHLIVAAGTSTDVQHSGNARAFGATFADMATLATHEGLTSAMALDSGGSVSLFDRGQPIFQGGDFRGTDHIIERPLAHALLAKSAR